MLKKLEKNFEEIILMTLLVLMSIVFFILVRRVGEIFIHMVYIFGNSLFNKKGDFD